MLLVSISRNFRYEKGSFRFWATLNELRVKYKPLKPIHLNQLWIDFSNILPLKFSGEKNHFISISHQNQAFLLLKKARMSLATLGSVSVDFGFLPKVNSLSFSATKMVKFEFFSIRFDFYWQHYAKKSSKAKGFWVGTSVASSRSRLQFHNVKAQNSKETVRIGLLGASGYTGAEVGTYYSLPIFLVFPLHFHSDWVMLTSLWNYV